MSEEYPVDSKLKLNRYRRTQQSAVSPRQELEKRLEVANYGQMIKKSEQKP